MENREGDVVADGVAKSEVPLPDEADAAANALGVVDAPVAAELVSSPAT